MSPRIFFGVLLIIVLGWFAAGSYADSQQLEHPVFLDHYIDGYAQDSLQVQFYFLTNKGDNNSINVVELGNIAGFTDGYTDFFMEETPYVQRYGPHELRTISITFDMNEIRSLKEKLFFNEMTIHMSDGKQFVADIGEIIIHPPERTNSYMSQMSTGDGEWQAAYLQAEENMTILELNPHLPDEGLTALKIHIPQREEFLNESNFLEKVGERLEEGKGQDYRDLKYPIRLKEGEGFALSIKNNENVEYVLNSWMMIEGEDENSRALKGPAYLHHVPELSGKNVKAIIERKGAAE